MNNPSKQPLPSIRKIPLSLVTSTILAMTFLGLVVAVQKGVTQALDEQFLRNLHQILSSRFDGMLAFLTAFGGTLFVALTACVITLILLSRRAATSAFFVVASIGGAAVLSLWLKLIFERARPELWVWGITESSFAFPSAHAIASSALALVLIRLSWQTAWRWKATTGAVLYVLLIALTRLGLGVHYPSDIVGGWLVGVAWVLLIWTIAHHTWPAARQFYKNKKLNNTA